MNRLCTPQKAALGRVLNAKTACIMARDGA